MYFLNFNDGFIEVPFASPSLNIYTVGCEHHCSGCHAKDLQDINHPNRKELTSELIISKLRMIPGFYKSICWLGGDPFYQFDDCLKISLEVKEWKNDIINVIYTGYELKDFWLKLTNEQKDKLYDISRRKKYSYANLGNMNQILPFDYVIDGKWNGKKLGEDGCNQKVWKVRHIDDINSFNFDFITYDMFKKGK